MMSKNDEHTQTIYIQVNPEYENQGAVCGHELKNYYIYTLQVDYEIFNSMR